jgi:hypothetical protein
VRTMPYVALFAEENVGEGFGPSRAICSRW